ncbi:unnamed protein product [Schistocephalus solidus]|uniref:Uncharacterized protein n=1 Tax=Schistocephalus solidus TaxID=70667 RepID=A0A3P7D5S1_SCHSO|nr:unnamed protein product [Schistocephalus solidus]
MEQTTLQVADGQLPTNKLKPLARTSFSFSGSQKSNLYSLLNPQDIGSTNDREAFASSGPYCGNLIEASDQPSPLSSHASFKVAVCVSPPSSLVLNVTFTNDHSTPTVVTDPSSLGLALRETTKSTNHSDRDSYSPSPKKIFAPVACSSPNASLLESAVVREYLARVVYKYWCCVPILVHNLSPKEQVHATAVRRNEANSQVAPHSTRTGHKFKFDEAEILARGDNRVSRELLESWFTGPQSSNKCNDLPNPYLVLRLSLARAIGHSGSAQVNTFSNASAGEPDGRAIITPPSNTGDEISGDSDQHAGHQTINAPERSPGVQSPRLRQLCILAHVTAENPFSGLKENDNFQQSDEQKLTVKKFHTASIFLHSPFTRPDLYWPLQFPYVASMKMPVQNATWIEQFKAHNLTPPGSKSTSEAECFYHDGDGDCRLPVRRRLISDNSATVSVCPSVSDEYLLDSLTSKVQTEQVRHRFKELEKKSDSTYLRLSSSISSTCAPFKIVDPIFGHRSGDSALLHNLANSCDKTVRPRLLPPPPPLSTSTCLSVPSSPQPRRTKSTQAASSLACSLPHPESPSEDSSKSTAERRRQASAGGNPLGRHEAVARRIRRQEINLMTPVSF